MSIHIDPRLLKLGKGAPRHLVGLPLFNKYTAGLAAAPDSVSNSSRVTGAFGEMLNDKNSCCTCSAAGHAVQTWTADSKGKTITVPDSAILTMYEGSCGYNPSDPSTDQGGIEADVLKYWHQNPLDGHSIDAFAPITPGDHASIKDSIWMLGGCYIGLALPISAQHQDVWDVIPSASQSWMGQWIQRHHLFGYASSDPDPTPGSWGGHAVWVCDYDSRGLVCVTWGVLHRMTWNFWDRYCDEAWALLSKDFVEDNGETPSGFSYDEMITNMGLMKKAA